MSAHAQISKSRSKKKPFKVVIIAENGEPLNVAQLFTTKLNVKKNLLAVMAAFSGKTILVKDATAKEQKDYHLYSDGVEAPLIN